MSTSKHIDKICIAVAVLALVVTILFMFGKSLGIKEASHVLGYEDRLFDTEKVHSIEIIMDDWDSFIATCENEEYSACTVLIDGEKYGNIGIRAKGNTSLSSVKTMGSSRYSFKLEFDQFDEGKSYHGLDKLCLNNLIQDNTMMKDYLAYTLMEEFGADAPLCSYAYITVNGEDWGLYLAVEGVEDSFLSRNYGTSAGDLYKPDSMNFGGGRGNGRDFDMDKFDFGGNAEGSSSKQPEQDGNSGSEQQPGGFDPGSFDFGSFNPGEFNPGNFNSGEFDMENFNPGDFAGADFGGFPGGNFPGGDFPQPGISETDAISGTTASENTDAVSGATANGENTEQGTERTERKPANGGNGKGFGGFGGFGMGNADVKLQYIDDDPDSYPNIFDSAKTKVSKSDKKRLIASLKSLSEYENLEDVLDMDEVLRYFVVHNFVVNGDSYTGNMIHNYYLHESDGHLAMIPWDYNLAFGTFMGGNASSSVNDSIDNPVSGGSVDDRPMVGWIFSDEKYTKMYHELFSEFVTEWIDGGKLENLIEDTAELIRPYVEKDPTKFCTSEAFEKGVSTIKQFVALRGEAVKRQLNGDSTPVDCGDLNTSDMGSMGGGMKGGFGPGAGRNEKGNETGQTSQKNEESAEGGDFQGQGGFSGDGNFPNQGGFNGNFPGGNGGQGGPPSRPGNNPKEKAE
ncbi:MAG: CotH kinase family protein [Eubacteriales bacterium]|nr:CotH kinase family protein [Eubacteriales bacterium]